MTMPISINAPGREQPGHRRRHQAGGQENDHRDQHGDRLLGAGRKRNGLSPHELWRIDYQHVRIVEMKIEGLPRAKEQYRVARFEDHFLGGDSTPPRCTAMMMRSPLSVIMPGKTDVPIIRERGGMIISARPELRLNRVSSRSVAAAS